MTEPMRTHNYVLVAGDTDGIAFRKEDNTDFSQEEQDSLLAELNSYMDSHIKWENDGVFPRQLVVKAKNYVLVDRTGKRKIKGSALKATTKEKALQGFTRDIIELLLTDKEGEVSKLYFRYASDIVGLKDIANWCSKHTVTKAVLTGKGTTQTRLRAALQGKKVQEGDKFYTFFKTPSERCLMENFRGEFDRDTLLSKLYDTLCIFETVIDVKVIPNLTLKKHKKLLQDLVDANSQLQMQEMQT